MSEQDPKMRLSSQPSDDQIDFYRYARLVAANWVWLAAPAILGLVAAIVAGFLLPPTYEAVALVAIDQAADRPADDALIEFAMSDGILQKTLDQLSGDAPIASDSLAEFRADLSAHYTRPFVVLSATAEDPVVVASIANQWATTLRNRMNTDLRPQASSDSPVDPALDRAEQDWREAEMALIASDAQLRHEQLVSTRRVALARQAELGMLDLRLDALASQAGALAEQLRLEGADQAASQGAVISVRGIADEVSRLGLGGSLAGLSGEEEFLGGHAVSEWVNDDLIDAAGILAEVIAARRGMIQAERDALEIQLAATATDWIDLQMQLSELELHRDVARAAVLAASRDQPQQSAAGPTQPQLARVASTASPPSEPRSPRPVRDGVLAGMAGALLGLGALLLRDWRDMDEQALA
jgi:capsular polysaccharide biosynthesis protein